jgi:3-oxoacyl-[acyl-carrier protein] reductase
MELGLRNKVVLVTGASKGLGAAIAIAFGREGSQLVLVARTKIELERVAAEAKKQGAADVLAIAADLTQTHAIDRVVSEAIDQFGTIHVLVNNAGILGSFSLFEDLTDDECSLCNSISKKCFRQIKMARNGFAVCIKNK